MFDDIGEKVKGLAKAICWIGIIGSIIAGIFYWSYASKLHAGFTGFLVGLGIIVGGALLSWIGSLTIYALGEAVDSSYEILTEQRRNSKKLSKVADMLEDIYDENQKAKTDKDE